MGALVGLVLIEPVIGCGQTNGPLTHGQQMRFEALATANRMPAALMKENPAPGVKAICNQSRIITKEIAPLEAGTL